MTKVKTTSPANPKKLRYVVYARKSTEDIEKQVLSLDAQKDKNQERFPNLNVVAILEESKSAFEPDKRPVFKNILDMLDKGEVDGIIGWHPDRISRNEVDASAITWRLRQGIIKDLKFANFTFEDSPEGIMMLQMTMSQSQYFSAKLSKDVKRGNEAKRKIGGITGPAPEGYLNNKAKKTVYKDPKRYPLIRKAFDLYLTGEFSVQDILRTMNEEWGYITVKRKKIGGQPLSRSALYHIFRNVRYAGWIPETYDPDILYPADFPAMITQEEYDQVQILLGRHGNKRLGTRKEFILRGFIRCGVCDCVITAESKEKLLVSGKINIHTYYHCTGKKKGGCHQKSIYVTEDDLFNQCVEELDNHELIPELYQWSMEAINDMRAKEAPERKQVETMQTETINSVKEQLDKLLDMSTRGLIEEDQFVKKNKILLAELKQLHKKQKTQNKDTESWYEYMCRLVKTLSNCNEKFANGTIADKKEILTAIGQNPVLIDGKLQVTPDDWLIPLRNSTKEIREEVIKVRLMSEQIRNKLLEALRIRWYTL